MRDCVEYMEESIGARLCDAAAYEDYDEVVRLARLVPQVITVPVRVRAKPKRRIAPPVRRTWSLRIPADAPIVNPIAWADKYEVVWEHGRYVAKPVKPS